MAVYSRSFSLFAPANPAMRTPSRPRRAGLLVTLAVIVGLMSILYLVQIQRVATQGYALEQLALQRTNLVRRNEQLQFSAAQAQSLETVRARAQAMGMQPLRATQTRRVTVPHRAPHAAAQAR